MANRHKRVRLVPSDLVYSMAVDEAKKTLHRDNQQLSRYFVYLVRCADDSLYCGFTVDMEKRLKRHNEGKGAKYTRSRLPVALELVSRPLTLSQALRLELKVKHAPRDKKIELLREYV